MIKEGNSIKASADTINKNINTLQKNVMAVSII